MLLLHGGRARAAKPSRLRDLSYLRMVPFGPAIRHATGGRVATTLVHNTDGGWIAPSGSGVVQCRALVRRLSQDHGLPVVLVGHSSGGWVALRAGGEPGVAGVVALAPWVGEQDPVEHLRGTPVRVVHGDADRICSPARAGQLVDRLRAKGGDAAFVPVAGGEHAMLRDAPRWHRLAAEAVLDVLPPV